MEAETAPRARNCAYAELKTVFAQPARAEALTSINCRVNKVAVHVKKYLSYIQQHYAGGKDKSEIQCFTIIKLFLNI